MDCCTYCAMLQLYCSSINNYDLVCVHSRVFVSGWILFRVFKVDLELHCIILQIPSEM